MPKEPAADYTRAMKKHRLLALLICLALAAACGTKGDLVLPPAETEKTPPPAAP